MNGPSAQILRAALDAQLVSRAGEVVASKAHDVGIRASCPLTQPVHQNPEWLALQQAALGTLEIDALREAVRVAVSDRLGRTMEGRQGDVIRAMPPRTPPTPAHQDGAYVAVGTVTAWVPLTDCPLELGPLGFVPGSGAGPLLPHDPGGAVGVEGRLQFEPLQAGDLLIFGPATVHGSAPNRSERVRFSVDFRFIAAQ